jgi:hypothetical protein
LHRHHDVDGGGSAERPTMARCGPKFGGIPGGPYLPAPTDFCHPPRGISFINTHTTIESTIRHHGAR